MSSPIGYQELAGKLGAELDSRVSASEVRKAVLELRTAKGMVLDPTDHDTWSVGSFFINPRLQKAPQGAPAWEEADGSFKVSAAWLIEESGFRKGFTVNDRAALSSKHTLAVTNRGDATSDDIFNLGLQIRDGVLTKFGIDLKPEPRFVGFDF